MKRWSGAESYGFTAIELIIVIAIIAIILAIAIPAYANYQDKQSLRSALSQVESDLRNAQVKTKATSVQYKVEFVADSKTYSITPLPNGAISTVTLPGNVVAANAVAITYLLPFATSEASVTFGGVIQLRTPRGTMGTIAVADATGLITTAP
jgi:type IV fimbrial biogenesis protein FimT